jgi:hypothetical protein
VTGLFNFIHVLGEQFKKGFLGAAVTRLDQYQIFGRFNSGGYAHKAIEAASIQGTIFILTLMKHFLLLPLIEASFIRVRESEDKFP